jgi:hypothetical protein
MVAAEEAASAMTITRLRPTISEIVPAAIIDIARTPVVSESERLLTAGETSNTRAKTGSSGCTL